MPTLLNIGMEKLELEEFEVRYLAGTKVEADTMFEAKAGESVVADAVPLAAILIKPST